MWRSGQRWVGPVLAVVVAGGVLVAGPAEAFAPHDWFSGRDDSHQSITERVFRDLAEEFFDISPPTKGMRAAMEEWTKANAAVDNDQETSALHFDGENFEGGQERLTVFSDTTVRLLERDNPKGARALLGGALHTVQDFYSHSNWVELGNAGANPDLGRAGRVLGPVAGPDEVTCRGSELVTAKLTSGYYGGEDVKPKIEGKCRHGGQFDKGEPRNGGGINKDFKSYPELSPHAEFNLAAVTAAAAGTEQYIRDIKEKVTERQLRALFGVGPTLAVAIDNTMSMQDEIGAVRSQVAGMVDARIGTAQEPSKYVLVPVNDVPFEAITTTDPDEFKQALNGLGLSGSRECPVRSMQGLLQAIQLSEEDSEVFLFTDADPVDPELQPEAMLRAQLKGIRISPMIFGGCNAGLAAKGEAHTTAGAAAAGTYRTIASRTGGQLFELDTADAGSIASLAGLTNWAGSVSVLNAAVPLADESTVLTVPVDATMHKVIFAVNGPRGETQATTLTRPDGSVVKPDDEGVESIPLGREVGPTTLLVVNRPAVGEWTVTIKGTGTASVRVSADSDLDLDTFEFVSPDAVEPGPKADYPKPVTQHPLPGPVAVHAVLSGDVHSAGFEFRAADGTVQSDFTLPRNGTDFAGRTTLPAGSPVVYVRGEDTSGVVFQRTITTPIQQSNPNLVLTPSSPEPMLPGAKVHRTLTVRNLGPAGTFLVGQHSNQSFADTGYGNGEAVTLGTGESGSASFDFRVPRLTPGDTELDLTYVVREDGNPTNVAVVDQAVPILVHPDKTPPVVTATTDPRPGPDGTFTDVVTLRLTATDASGIKGITFTTGETNTGDKVAGASVVVMEIRTEGLTRVWYQATDQTGLASDWEHIDIALDAHLDEAALTWSTTPGGASVRPANRFVGHNPRVAFPGRAGQRISIGLRDFEYSAALPLRLSGPDGTVLAEVPECYGTCLVEPVTLPADGTYTLLIDPYRDNIGAVTVQVYDAPVIPTVPITLDGAKTTLTTAVPGQNSSVSFPAQAGQRVSILASGNTYGSFPAVYYRSSNGFTVPATGGFDGSGGGGFFNPVTLPAAGVWTVWVDPGYLRTGSVTLQVYDVPADVSARADPGAAAVTVRTVAPGQGAALTFAGESGQRLIVDLFDGDFPAGEVQVLGPDGSRLKTVPSCSSRCTFELPLLDATGDYRVLFPAERTVMRMTGRTLVASTEAKATVVVGGPEVTFTTTLGQKAVVSFAGTAGRKVTVTASLPGYEFVSNDAVLRDPSGTVVNTQGYCYNPCVFAAVVLPTTGTYTMTFTPSTGFAGPITARAYDISTDVSVPAAVGGAAVSVVIPAPGQDAVVPFAATAGQRVSVALSAGSFNGQVTATLLGPDGSTVASNTTCTSSCFFEPTSTSAAGTYKLLVDPQANAVGSVTVRVYAVPPDAAATATIGGAGPTVTTTVPGQNAVVSFAGTAGRVVTVTVSGATFTGTTTYTVRRPDGTALSTKTATGAGTSFTRLTLPVAGTYTVLLNPSGTVIGSAKVTLTSTTAAGR